MRMNKLNVGRKFNVRCCAYSTWSQDFALSSFKTDHRGVLKSQNTMKLFLQKYLSSFRTSSLDKLVKRWSSEAVDALPSENEEAVRSTFGKLGLCPTTDVIRLYGTIGGMKMMDNEYWRLWGLSEIEAENLETSEYGILFSDYCINCWSYRLKRIDSETSAVYVDYSDEKPPYLVATSLTQFLDKYVLDARALLEKTRST